MARKIRGKATIISHKPRKKNVSRMKEWQPESGATEGPSKGRTRKHLLGIFVK